MSSEFALCHGVNKQKEGEGLRISDGAGGHQVSKTGWRTVLRATRVSPDSSRSTLPSSERGTESYSLTAPWLSDFLDFTFLTAYLCNLILDLTGSWRGLERHCVYLLHFSRHTWVVIGTLWKMSRTGGCWEAQPKVIFQGYCLPAE